MHKLIEEFKGLIHSACLDIALIQLDREKAIKEKVIILKTQRNLRKIIKSFDVVKHYENYKVLLDNLNHSLLHTNELEIKLTKVTKRFLTPGKNKIYAPICIELLKAIDICEVNNIDLLWLKTYLKPHGELYEDILSCYPIESDILLPTPSHATNNKMWIHRLKETLQRSLFAGDGKVINKKTDNFIRTRDQFYEDIRAGNDEIYKPYKLKRR
jgi:hypothetical protein